MIELQRSCDGVQDDVGRAEQPPSHRQERLMPDNQPSGAKRAFGDFAPELVHFTDDLLFGEGWSAPDLSPWDRGLVTVASLVTCRNTGQLASSRLRHCNAVTKQSSSPPSPTSRSMPGGRTPRPR
jgi:hypothetical protein